MIKTQAERVDEHLQRSKYFRKHYEVETPYLTEVTCHMLIVEGFSRLIIVGSSTNQWLMEAALML